MSQIDWQRLGFLTPDAPESLREVWALQAMLHRHLADCLDGLALQTAEPTWQATLDEGAGRTRELVAELAAEAGELGTLTVSDDELIQQFDGAVGEVVASGHVPSLLVTGYAVLGELSRAPMQLLEEVAGPYGKLLCGKVVAAEHHRVLGRLAGIVPLDDKAKNGLRRLLRHLNGILYSIYQAWRQTFHVLGVDGEDVVKQCRESVAEAYKALGLKASRSDLAIFTT
jgi:hypothetical protein